MATKLLKQRVG